MAIRINFEPNDVRFVPNMTDNHVWILSPPRPFHRPTHLSYSLRDTAERLLWLDAQGHYDHGRLMRHFDIIMEIWTGQVLWSNEEAWFDLEDGEPCTRDRWFFNWGVLSSAMRAHALEEIAIMNRATDDESDSDISVEEIYDLMLAQRME
jgi:hypothetical protein